MVETESVRRGLCGKVSYGCREVAFRGAGVGLEAPFGESPSVEDGLYRGRRGRGEDFGRESGVFDVVEGEASAVRGRSEEHTSELQSRQYLVCRLLLEKKKHNIYTI